MVAIYLMSRIIRVALLVLTIFFVVSIFSLNIIYTHPGRTAKDGCHYCRTNCDRWGVPWYQRHCYGKKVPKLNERPRQYRSY